MSSIDTQILHLLQKNFVGCAVDLANESHLHAGHTGDNGTGASHFAVHIKWQGFKNISRIHRQRMVHQVLSPLVINGPIHALSIKASV